jgi:hypothetical protein
MHTREGRQQIRRRALPLVWLVSGLLAFDLYVFAAQVVSHQSTKVPVPPLYLPIAAILSVLLLTPRRRWWWYLSMWPKERHGLSRR